MLATLLNIKIEVYDIISAIGGAKAAMSTILQKDFENQQEP